MESDTTSILFRTTITSHSLNPCNHTLSTDIIKGLNQICKNSIKFPSNLKSRTDF
jgi:hypothetical protein